VTIFGESAGGIAVSMLCASPLAKGCSTARSQKAAGHSALRGLIHARENMKRLADAELSGVATLKEAGVSSIAKRASSLPISFLAAVPGRLLVAAIRRA